MSQPKKPTSNTATLTFMVALCFACALILSVLSSSLAELQDSARNLDRAKQMLMAAKIYHRDGYFLTTDSEGNRVPAKLVGDTLVAGEASDQASADQIFSVYHARIHSFLVDASGKRFSFQEAGINEDQYLLDFRKEGYDRQPYKLAYEILPNPTEKGEGKPEGYLFHIAGFGLWDAIYGYLAVGPDANTVIGISWYEHKETPGLGANITEAPWQGLFPGKHIFESAPGGDTDFNRAPIGITVVRGLVADVYPSGPKAESAVDGMAGATLTGNGVTKAYKETLENYRPFLLKVRDEFLKSNPSSN